MQYLVYAVDKNGCSFFEQIFNQSPSNERVTELRRDGYKHIYVESRYSTSTMGRLMRKMYLMQLEK